MYKNVEILPHSDFTTFHLRHSRGEMYIGHGRLCVCVSACVSISLSLAAFPHYCTDPDATCGNCGGALSLCTIGRICSRCTRFVAV